MQERLFLRKLLCDVRKEAHESSPLHCQGELALCARTYVRPLGGENASMRIEELLEKLRVLIVDMLYVILLKEALFCHRF